MAARPMYELARVPCRRWRIAHVGAALLVTGCVAILAIPPADTVAGTNLQRVGASGDLDLGDAVPVLAGGGEMRLYDSRPGFATLDGVGGDGLVKRATVRRVPVVGRAGIAADDGGLLLNVVAVQPSRAGYVRVWPCNAPQPTATALYANAGEVVSNTVPIVVGNSELCVVASADVHVVIDLVDRLSAAGGFVGRHTRVANSSSGYGGRRLAANTTRAITTGAPSAAGFVNVTAQLPSRDATLQVTSCPPVDVDSGWLGPSITVRAGQQRTNLVMVDDVSRVCVRSSASTDIIVDLLGWVSSIPAPDDTASQSDATESATAGWASAVSDARSVDLPANVPTPLPSGAPGTVAPPSDALVLELTGAAISGRAVIRVFPCAEGPAMTSAMNLSVVPVTHTTFARPDMDGAVCAVSNGAATMTVRIRGGLSVGGLSLRVDIEATGGCGWVRQPETMTSWSSTAAPTLTQAMEISGGRAPYRFELSLPDGWSGSVGAPSSQHHGNAAISLSIPDTAAGAYPVTVTITDGAGAAHTASITVVRAPSLIVC